MCAFACVSVRVCVCVCVCVCLCVCVVCNYDIIFYSHYDSHADLYDKDQQLGQVIDQITYSFVHSKQGSTGVIQQMTSKIGRPVNLKPSSSR